MRLSPLRRKERFRVAARWMLAGFAAMVTVMAVLAVRPGSIMWSGSVWPPGAARGTAFSFLAGDGTFTVDVFPVRPNRNAPNGNTVPTGYAFPWVRNGDLLIASTIDYEWQFKPVPICAVGRGSSYAFVTLSGLWLSLLAVGLWVSWIVLLRRARKRRRLLKGLCPRCDYPRTAGQGVCSECGADLGASAVSPATPSA